MDERREAARVLVVEDDRTINDALADRLVAEGYRVEQVFDGPAALARAAEVAPDLVLLDVMLPGLDGYEVCRRLQAERPVPVLMLTARDTETDLLVGLGIGADDYLTKPFRMREVLARVSALLRRVDRAAELAAPAPSRTWEFGDLSIDPLAHRVRLAGREVHLTATEFALLVHLAAEPDRVHSREQLVAAVWGWGESVGAGRTVDSHVKALRAKLRPEFVRTVHGVGYALQVGA